MNHKNSPFLYFLSIIIMLCFFRHWFLLKWDYLTTFLEENRQNIFYLFVFYVVTIGLFVERFAHYSFMSEHLDLRHIMGVGIAITRGSAASLSFCYSLLLLTMSRNLLTKLKVSLNYFMVEDNSSEPSRFSIFPTLENFTFICFLPD